MTENLYNLLKVTQCWKQALSSCQNTIYNMQLFQTLESIYKISDTVDLQELLNPPFPLNYPDPTSQTVLISLLVNSNVLMGFTNCKPLLFQSISCQINILQTH